LHIKGLTPSVPSLSPKNQDQSGTQGYQNGTTTRAPPSALSPTAEITQEHSSTSVDAEAELKSFLASVLDLFKQLQDENTQRSTEDSRTQAQPVSAQLTPEPAESHTITEGNAALLDDVTMNTVIKEVDPARGCSLASAQSLSDAEVPPTSVQSSPDPIQHPPSTDSLCHNQTTGSVDLVPCPTPIDSQALPETQLVVDNAQTLTRESLNSHGPVLDNEREDVLHEREIPSFPAIRSPSTVEEPLSFPGVSTSTIIPADRSPHVQQVLEPPQSNNVMRNHSLEEDDIHAATNPVFPVPVSFLPAFPARDSEEFAERRLQSKPRDLTVSAILNGQRIKALVDTGAAVSVIDENFLKEIYQGHLPPLQKHSSGDVKTVSGAPLPVSGRFATTLEIAKGLYSCTFLVVRDLTYDTLLGRDFLRANGAVIDLKDSTLQLEESIARPHSEGACPVRVLYNCVIPASSEAVIPAYLDQTYIPGDVGFVEASPRLIERYQLQRAASLVTVSTDHTVPFRVINPTRKPVTLYGGATLRTFSQTDESLQVFSLSTKTAPTKELQAEVPDVPVDLADASQQSESQKVRKQSCRV